MQRNFTELEQRLVVILKEDSRKTMSELAQEMNISRTTAKKVMDSLMDSGRIRAFTIQLDEDENDLVIVHVEDASAVPKRYVLEDFELIDGTHMVVIHYENLVKLRDVNIIDVKIAKKRVPGENPGRTMHVHCDLCGNEIINDPLTLKMKGKTYYSCCPSCEKSLRIRLSEIEV